MGYYQRLNQLVQQKLGGYHSAPLLLKSIDYHTIKSCYQDGWDKIPALLKAEIDDFLLCKPDCLILCNNTLHKAYDLIADDLQLSIPFFHAVTLTAEYAQEQGYKNLLLLGTKFTMEDNFFTDKIKEKSLSVTVPSATEREEIQAIQSQLAQGHMDAAFTKYFSELIGRYTHLDAVILACTELPLAITAESSPLPIINPTELQCLAAVAYSFS